jgi:hypothetical protein
VSDPNACAVVPVSLTNVCEGREAYMYLPCSCAMITIPHQKFLGCLSQLTEIPPKVSSLLDARGGHQLLCSRGS